MLKYFLEKSERVTRRDYEKTQIGGPRLGEGQGERSHTFELILNYYFSLLGWIHLVKASSLFPGPRAP